MAFGNFFLNILSTLYSYYLLHSCSFRSYLAILEEELPWSPFNSLHFCDWKPFFFFLINLFYYLFLAVLGLCFCARAFSSCGKQGPLFIAVCGPLTIAASLVTEHRLQTRRLSSCGSRAQLLRGMWDLPRPGLEPVSPASAGRFSTTAPPGKPENLFFLNEIYDNGYERPI